MLPSPFLFELRTSLNNVSLKTTLIAFALAISVAACGGGESGTAPVGGSVVASGPGTAPGDVPAPTAVASCGTSSDFLAVGPAWQFDTQYYGADGTTIVSSNNTSLRNTGSVLFKGANAVETVANGTITQVIGSGVTNANLKIYNNIIGPDKVFYGFVSASPAATVTNSFNPPQRSRMTPSIGATEVFNTVETQEITPAGGALISSSASLTISRNTVGIETITVPAGTLSVCRTDVISNYINAAGETTTLSNTEHTLATGACKGQVARLTNRATSKVDFEMTHATKDGISCL